MKKQYICLFFACLTFLLTGCDKYWISSLPEVLFRIRWLNIVPYG